MPDSKFGFELVGIGSALTNRRLAVPIYQRSYAWGSEESKERDQVAEFWNDLRATFVTQNDEYFLGTVVLAREGADERASIIDGQQRLATTAVLLAAIRDEFSKRGDVSRAAIVQNKLAEADLASASNVPQLKLNAEDDPFFRKRVVEGDTNAEATLQSHRLIARAYEALRQKIGTTADDAATGWSDRLVQWIQFIEERVKIIVVDVPTEADAFLIFETLNDRGADLTIADLLKNYLFRRAGTDLDTVRNAWVSSLANLDVSAAGSQLFTDYLRHYWSSKYGATRERELYARIKDKVATSSTAVDLALELQSSSRLYSAILHSDHEYWSGFDSSIRNNIDVLQILKLEQNRPLLLAVMQHLPVSELRKTLRAMVSWSVRGLIVGGIGGGTAERIYCDAAVKVRSGGLRTAADIAAELSAIVRSNKEFEERFALAHINRGPLARYLLAALERTKRGTSEPELVPNENEAEVNLEHILPKNPVEEDWPQFKPEERAAYVHRLGNMALLSRGPNGKIGNRPFTHKKPILGSSELKLTKEAGEEDDWTTAAIDARQERLAALAVQTWTLTP